MILLDTNILSEATSPVPNPSVVAWFSRVTDRMVTSVIVIAELRYGVAILPDGKKKKILIEAVEAVQSKVLGDDGVLPFDEATATLYADLAARLRRSGDVIGQSDTMIAATALQHDATVATRNVRHFLPCGVRVADPFEGP